jgi:transposase
VKGRKRHLLVDTNGLIVHVLVHEANLQDHHGGKLLLEALSGSLPRLKLIWAESAYKKGGAASSSGSKRRSAGRWRSSNIPGAAFEGSGPQRMP